jgi:integrase
VRVKRGSPEFDALYHDWLRRTEAGEYKPAPRDTPKPCTLRWLGVQYIRSNEFGQLEPRTQYVTRRILESIYLEPIARGAKETFADCPIADFGAKAVGILRDRKRDHPEAANNRLKRLRAMFRWAMLPAQADLAITANPARDVRKLKPKRKGGFPRWKPADLDEFETCHPIGNKARLAFALLMFTGARRSDVVRLGRPHVRGGPITWVPYKGRNQEEPVEVSIPVLPELRSVIEATPAVGTTTFLVTDYGRPFTANGFGNKMCEWCKKAGLSGLNAHGVRKPAATRMADRGANACVDGHL